MYLAYFFLSVTITSSICRFFNSLPFLSPCCLYFIPRFITFVIPVLQFYRYLHFLTASQDIICFLIFFLTFHPVVLLLSLLLIFAYSSTFVLIIFSASTFVYGEILLFLVLMLYSFHLFHVSFLLFHFAFFFFKRVFFLSNITLPFSFPYLFHLHISFKMFTFYHVSAFSFFSNFFQHYFSLIFVFPICFIFAFFFSF